MKREAMLVRLTSDLFLNFLPNAEEIGEDLLEVVEMLLYALSLNYPQLIELLPEEKSIGEILRHI